MPHTNAPRDFHPFPLFAISICLTCGILVAQFTSAAPTAYVAVGLMSAALALLSFYRNRISLVTLFVAISFTAAGGALFELDSVSTDSASVKHAYRQGIIAAGAPIEVTGALAVAPEIAPDGVYLTLRVDELSSRNASVKAGGAVWLFASARDEAARAELEALRLRRGARVRVMTALERSDRFRNPGVGTLTEFLERKNYDAVGSVKSPLLIERLNDERIFPPLLWLDAWRESLLRQMQRLFSPATAGVLAASLLGNRYLLASASAERFREGGTFHVLVISGMHITFIGGLVLTLARFLTKRRFWQFALSLIILWSYTLMVGAEISVVRAALTFSFVALAPILFRRAHPLNAVGASALALLVWRPSDLSDSSFQLTFLSVLAIVSISWPLLARAKAIGAWRPARATPYPPRGPRWLISASQLLYWNERAWRADMLKSVFRYQLNKHNWAIALERSRLQSVLRYAAAALVVSASVQLALLPLLIVYFHRLSIASLILNIVVGALMAMLSLASLIALALSHMSSNFAAPFVWLAEHLNWLMTHSVDPFARWGVASMRLPEYTGWPAMLYVIYYVPLVALIIALARWNAFALPHAQRGAQMWLLVTHLSAMCFALCLLLIVFHPWSENTHAGRLEVSFLDVGQGDAALVVLPDRTTLLIDGGGRPRFAARSPHGDDEAAAFEPDRRSIGEAVVSEYLWWRGLDRIDYVVATHADADHIQGLADVVRNFRVRAALVARTPADSSEYKRFAAALESRSVPVSILKRGDTLRAGDSEISVLWPQATNDLAASSGNNDSLVLMLRYGRRRVLLTGDVEAAAEWQLLTQGQDLHCDVVKVAHHGSRTSSLPRFVERARASLAIISVGQASPFGHPAGEVVERWREQGARVLTTGHCGTVTVMSDGDDLQVETYVTR